MSYLMAADEAYELPHEFVVELHFTCPGIDSSCLYHVPIVHQLHDIVIPTDVALQYFS